MPDQPQTWPPETLEGRIEALKQYMAEIGHPVTVTSRGRTPEQQKRLYAQGRSSPGHIVTELSGEPGHESKHQLGDAVDLAFTDKLGNPSYWEGHPWDKLGAHAKELGLEWGGDWTTLKDRPHVQMPNRAKVEPGTQVDRQFTSDLNVSPSRPTPPQVDRQYTSDVRVTSPQSFPDLSRVLQPSPQPSPQLSQQEPKMPQIGERKTFPNGKVGEWDGQGWAHIPDQSASPVAPASIAAPNTNAQEPSHRSDLSRFLTGVVAPVAGGVVGGMVGGPFVGAPIGAMAGKAYGDLAGMALGDNPPDPTDEAMGLAATGATGLALGTVGSVADKLPGPLKWTNVGIGAAGGAGTGAAFGHPGLGAAIGGAMGGYNMLRGLFKGIGGATQARFGPQEVMGRHVPGTPYAPESPPPTAPSGNTQPFAPDVEETIQGVPLSQVRAQKPGSKFGAISDDALGRLLRQEYKGRGPMGPPPQGPGPQRPQANPLPNGGPVQPPSPPTPPWRRPRPSTEIPYQISDDMVNPYSTQVQGNQGSRVVPSAANNPKVNYSAQITTPGNFKLSNLEQGTPTQPDLDWNEYSAASGRTSPKRTSSKGVSFDPIQISRTPAEALKGLAFGDSKPSTASDTGGPPGGGPPGGRPTKVPSFTPQTVDDAEGLTLDQQRQWDQFKQSNPGTTDADLSSWLSSQGNMEPNAGLDVNGMVQRLMGLIKRR